jgi:ABC-type transport system involved in multi-copper enzyme maturation permease subunit
MPVLSTCARLYLPVLDPVFRKDLEGLSRRWGIYAGRMVYVGLVGLILYAFLSVFGPRSSTSRFADLGRTMFTTLVTLQMAYVTFAMAHLSADLLLREARSGTLLLMLLTPLSGWRIALGKWKAVMVHATMMILAGLPPLAIAAYLGGVGPRDLLWSSSVSLALAALSSAMGLYAALRSRTALRAAVAAVMSLMAPFVVLFLVAGVLFAMTRSSELLFVACLLHPALAAIGAFSPATFGELPGYAWIGASLGSLVLAQVYVMSAAGHLSISSTLDELLAPRGLAPSEQGPPAPTPEPREVWESHPLLWKELACRAMSKVGLPRRTIIVVLLPLFLYACGAVNLFSNGAFMGGWLLVLSGLAMASGAELFIRDKEDRHLEVLLTLPVSSARFVWAKLLSKALTLEGGAYLIWTTLMLESALGKHSLFLISSGPLLLFLFFSYVLSAVGSFYLRTQRGAFLLAASLVWSMLLGVSVLRQSCPESLLEALHPVVLGETILRSSFDAAPRIVVFVLSYGAVTALMVALLIRRFRRQVG